MPLNIGQIVKEQGSKAALDDIEAEKSKELDIEASTDGTAEASINAPWHGFTVTGFVKAPIKTMKNVAAGIRLSKRF